MNISKWLIIAGIILILVGILMKAGIQFGKLPGDLHFKSGKIQIYVPIVTSLIISLLLSLLFWLFKKSS